MFYMVSEGRLGRFSWNEAEAVRPTAQKIGNQLPSTTAGNSFK